MAAIRTKNSYRARSTAPAPRIGHGKAIGAVKHSIIGAIWHMLANGELYRDLGGDYFTAATPPASPSASSPSSNRSDTPSPAATAA